MYESEVQSKVRLILSKKGFVLFRNNVGAFKVGNRYVKYGLCEGSSDLIGFKKVKITKDMVGKNLSIFCAFETKRDSTSKITTEQNHFIEVVNRNGGIGKIIISPDEAEKIEIK